MKNSTRNRYRLRSTTINLNNTIQGVKLTRRVNQMLTKNGNTNRLRLLRVRPEHCGTKLRRRFITILWVRPGNSMMTLLLTNRNGNMLLTIINLRNRKLFTLVILSNLSNMRTLIDFLSLGVNEINIHRPNRLNLGTHGARMVTRFYNLTTIRRRLFRQNTIGTCPVLMPRVLNQIIRLRPLISSINIYKSNGTTPTQRNSIFTTISKNLQLSMLHLVNLRKRHNYFKHTNTTNNHSDKLSTPYHTKRHSMTTRRRRRCRRRPSSGSTYIFILRKLRTPFPSRRWGGPPSFKRL